jgi:hypothetical protein
MRSPDTNLESNLTIGPDLAQGLRLALSELWFALSGTAIDNTSRTPCGSLGSGSANFEYHLSAAEQSLAAYTRRIEKVHSQTPDSVPYISELLVPAPHPNSGSPRPSIVLRRVSQSVERLAQIAEALEPGALENRWRSEHGVSTLRDLFKAAVSTVVAHLESACEACTSSGHGAASSASATTPAPPRSLPEHAERSGIGRQVDAIFENMRTKENQREPWRTLKNRK